MKENPLEYIKKVFIDKTLKEQGNLIDEFANSNINEKHNSNYIQILLNKINFIKSNVIVGNDTYNDVEFFENFNQGLKSKTVFDIFDSFNTIGSKSLAKEILLKPIDDINILKNRRLILEEFSKKMNNTSDDKELFENLGKYEPNIYWLFENREQHIEDLLNIVYFKMVFFKKLNNYTGTLTGWNFYRILLSPVIGILSPIIYFLIPYLVILWKFKIPLTFYRYLKFNWELVTNGTAFMIPISDTQRYMTIISYAFSLIFYFQGIFASFEVSKTLHKLCSHITEKFNGVVKYLKSSKLLIEKYWSDNLYGNFINLSDIFKNNFTEFSYIDNLKDKKFSLFSNFGKQLHSFKFIEHDIINSILIKTYLLDFFKTIILTNRKNNFNFTTYIENNSTPQIINKGLRHPCLDINKVVKNDTFIKNNIIITGPNAGGKSTFIKAVLINIIFSQTITISTCDECSLTPFKSINSQINVPDTKGHESLFEAEMHRCLYNLKQLENTSKNDFVFIIMDEIFNSTNPVEGIAAAYAIVKKISEYNNCILIFTTHYIYLTKLAKNTDRFINYKMNVIITDGTITFPYKLFKGFSKQYIALELLKQNGFDEKIINDAIQIKNKLSAAN
jgi:DNA mismatch repair ATPase MutS